jgi:mutator protein MutT
VSATRLVVAGVFVSGGKLLLAQRSLAGNLPGLWEFPGGKVEEEESPEDALVREWREEMAVTPAGSVPYAFAREGRLTLLFFRVRGLLGTPVPVGCAGIRWCEAGEASLLAMPPADAPVVARLLAEGGGTFRDTADAETPRLLAEARERDPFIEGSAALTPGVIVKFRKQGLPGRPFVNGLLVATPEGPRAFENLCPHVPIPLDRTHDDIVSADGRTLVCQNHAALFEFATGRCVSGPCEGDSLREIPLVRAGDGWAVSPR